MFEVSSTKVKQSLRQVWYQVFAQSENKVFSHLIKQISIPVHAKVEQNVARQTLLYTQMS